ncbi:Hypothetical protein CINCED_3A002280 [Cinara cedri]|uniref:Uncharacterized protein n=1 Tax=Cinara cedri TaxID=506608 RepID=A0A5E4NDH1_9HEMI|nr:Hypothetical protein CINCED_3A002280 [Cinara cedri]
MAHHLGMFKKTDGRYHLDYLRNKTKPKHLKRSYFTVEKCSVKNVMVSDWKKLIEFLHLQGCISLDTGDMLMPSRVHDYDLFWSNFSKAITYATKLEALELYKYQIMVVHTST